MNGVRVEDRKYPFVNYGLRVRKSMGFGYITSDLNIPFSIRKILDSECNMVSNSRKIRIGTDFN